MQKLQEKSMLLEVLADMTNAELREIIRIALEHMELNEMAKADMR